MNWSGGINLEAKGTCDVTQVILEYLEAAVNGGRWKITECGLELHCLLRDSPLDQVPPVGTAMTEIFCLNLATSDPWKGSQTVSDARIPAEPW